MSDPWCIEARLLAAIHRLERRKASLAPLERIKLESSCQSETRTSDVAHQEDEGDV